MRSLRIFFVVSCFALVGLGATPGLSYAQQDNRCFAETGFCISGRIREFWEQNGGLPVFGFPIGPQDAETVEGRTFQAQWFERNRLELHPENTRPYDVLLGRLGDDRLVQQNRDWHLFPVAEPQGDCLRFATGHSVCGAFLAAWQANGLEFDGRSGTSYDESLALWGLPLSSPKPELIEGREYTVQWFERARFELHPENQPPYNVLGGLLGNEIRQDQSPQVVSAGAFPEELTVAGDKLFFVADDGVHGREPWVSDGSAAGTRLLKDILPGSEASAPFAMVALGNNVLFSAAAGQGGPTVLWRSDGTADGTYPLAADKFRDPWQLTVVGDQLFFVADDDAHGTELWVSDGSAEGTHLVKDIYPGTEGIYPRQNMPMGYKPFGLTAVGDRLFFNAEAPSLGYGLWVSDGSAEGTHFVARPPNENMSPEYWDMSAVNNQLMFVVRTSRLNYSLWKSNGTAQGTVQVRDFSYSQDPGTMRLYPPIGGLKAAGGLLYFNDGGTLWASDGSEQGTRRVFSSPVLDYADFNGSAFFTITSTPGVELWKSDGSEQGAQRVSFDTSGVYDSGGLAVAGGWLLVLANRYESGGRSTLLSSDGTAAGTRQVASLIGNWAASDGGVWKDALVATLNGQVLLVANDGTHGAELWKVDVGQQSAALLLDINQQP